jgi:beta-lactamase regulating signal transducer with metallopeptidase domain
MLDVAVRPALILGLAWVVARCLSRATPATRHLVWHSGVIAALAAPLLIPLAPKFEVASLPPSSTFTSELVSTFSNHLNSLNVSGAASTSTLGTPSTPGAPGTLTTSGTRTLGTQGTLGTLALLFWLAGSALVAAWFVAGWILTAIAARRARPAPSDWRLEVNALREKLRINGFVDVRVLRGHASPIVVGLTRTIVLLPSAALEWSGERRRSVLHHELAHVRRGDLMAQALGQAACALYWFNPLAWVAAVHLRSERERACDDEVLRSGARPSSYAQHLLEIAKDLRVSRWPSAALAMARPSELEGRLQAVLATGRRRVPAYWTRWVVTFGVSVFTLVSVGATPASIEAQPAAPAVARSRWLLEQDLPTPAERMEARRTVHAAAATLDTSPDPEVRRDAVLRIAASNADNSIAALTRALDDSSQNVREKAALSLALMSDPEVIPSLIHALSDSDAQVREKAAIGLALRRDTRVADALLKALDDPDSQVREKVVLALGTSGDPRARAALDRALTDPDSEVREKAATGLLILDNGGPAAQDVNSVREGLRGLLRMFAR